MAICKILVGYSPERPEIRQDRVVLALLHFLSPLFDRELPGGLFHRLDPVQSHFRWNVRYRESVHIIWQYLRVASSQIYLKIISFFVYTIFE